MFNIGDKVRVIRDKYTNDCPQRTADMPIGYVGYITEEYDDNGGEYAVDDQWVFDLDELELVHSQPTTPCGDCMGYPGCSSGCTKVNRSSQQKTVDLNAGKPLDKPQSNPQFSVGDFVVNSSNDIGRIEDILYGSNKVAYEVTFNLKTTKIVTADYLRAIK